MDKIVNKISNNYASIVVEKLGEGEEQKEIYAFGANAVIGEMLKTIIIFILAYVLGLLTPVVMAAISFAMLRTFAGGFHADSHFKCLIISIAQFIGAGFVSKLLNSYSIENLTYIPYLTYLICLAIVFKYAPVDTPNKPLKDNNIRKKLREKSVFILTILCITAYVTTLIGYPQFAIPIILGLLIQSFTLTPLGHKLYGLWR